MTATDTDPRLDQLRQEIARANERIRDLAGDLHAEQQESDQIADDLADALEEKDRACERLAFEQRRAAAALLELHQAREAYRTEQRRHQATVDEAAGQVAALTSDLEQKATALRIYIDDRHEMQAQVAALTSEVERLEAALVEYIDGRARDGARIISLECERAVLMHRLETVRVACDC